MAISSASSRRALVFFDASVLVAASRSPAGGSLVAIEVCRGRRFQAVVSHVVLLEARVNIAEKFGDAELIRFYQLIADASPEIALPPSAARLAECVPLTTEKDAHVLAAALECGAEFLLTLDRRHLLNTDVLAAQLAVSVMTPGDFLQNIVREAR